MKFEVLRSFLDSKVIQYNSITFIDSDPIQLPHLFSKKEDIEIIAFLISTIAWGNRKIIIQNGHQLLNIMGYQPLEYILNYQPTSTKDLKFVHRTFNSIDLDFFIRGLQNIYKKNLRLEHMFQKHEQIDGVKGRIINFRTNFFQTAHSFRSEKHISNPLKNSAAKRINMFLRWMCRKDNCGVDFGIWDSIPMNELMIPLDVHTGNISRKLELLKRTQNDWKSLEEIMIILRKMDPSDPAKYDFALFGLGAFENF